MGYGTVYQIYPRSFQDSDGDGVGDLASFDSLLAAAHARGLKLILDFVPNHSSDRHPWFVESRASRDNPKRDWYIWRAARPDGAQPNNWPATLADHHWNGTRAPGNITSTPS